MQSDGARASPRYRRADAGVEAALEIGATQFDGVKAVSLCICRPEAALPSCTFVATELYANCGVFDSWCAGEVPHGARL
jgi:hypothetical protein